MYGEGISVFAFLPCIFLPFQEGSLNVQSPWYSTDFDSILLRYAAMLRKLDKEIVFGRILVEKLIRHVMRTHLDAGFVCASGA